MKNNLIFPCVLKIEMSKNDVAIFVFSLKTPLHMREYQIGKGLKTFYKRIMLLLDNRSMDRKARSNLNTNYMNALKWSVFFHLDEMEKLD